MNVKIEGKHPLFMKDASAERNMLHKGTEEEKFYYICTHGIRDEANQMLMIRSYPELAKLQDFVFGFLWSADAKKLAIEHGIRPAENESDGKQVFRNWLYHCWKVSVQSYKDETAYGIAGTRLMSGLEDFSPVLSEEEQMELLESRDWEKIRKYGRKWKGRARTLFVQTAPIKDIFRYIVWFNFDMDEQAELELFRRGDSCLSWWYVFSNPISAASRRWLRKCGNLYIWKCAVMRHYTFLFEFEHKFGCIANWEKVLEASFDRKYLQVG